MTALSPRFVSLGFVSCWIIGVGTHAALAQNITIPISGTFQAGTADTLGLFGPVGADLSNQPFSVSVTYNSKEFSTPEIPQLNESYTAGAMTISITVNGITVSVTSVTSTPSADPATATANFLTPSDPSYGVVGAGSSFGLDYLTSGNASFQQPAPPLPAGIISISVSPAVGKYEFLQGTPQLLQVLSPFLVVKPSDLGEIELSQIVKKQAGYGTVPVAGLTDDGTSAAIVLLPTATSDAVTFTTDNGTVLFPYDDPAFMTHAPQTGGSSMLNIIPIKIGAIFYAAALLQAPPASVTPVYSSPIIVTAKQNGHTQHISLHLLPPPVLLVHGLWGDAITLTALQAKLESERPWSSYPGLIYEVDYSGQAAFNIGASQSLLSEQITSLLNEENAAGLVSSRVDVVAHSMGGLLLRSYSGGKSYQSVQNRVQGQFHTIVTLDTPEAGSKLASYLLAHQPDTITQQAILECQTLDICTPVTVWTVFCGASSSTNVGECFENSGRSVTAGAVGSLVPNNPALRNAPSPNINNASWFAVVSTNTGGLENTSLQALIDASNPTSDTVTLKSILGGVNDDIVTLASQLAEMPLSSVTLTKTAHATIFDHGNAVTNSPKAIAAAACWLADPTSAACAKPELVSYVNDDIEEDLQPVVGRFEVNDPPANGLIGKPLHINIKAGGAKEFRVEQIGKDIYKLRGNTSARDDLSARESLSRPSDLVLIPNVIGRVEFIITAVFSDKKFEVKRFSVDVGLDPSSITALRATRRFKTLVIPDAKDYSGFPLYPEVSVAGASQPIKIGDFAHYRIISPNVDPAITVDEHGVVHAHHSGEAVVEVSFGGHSDQLPVVVN